MKRIYNIIFIILGLIVVSIIIPFNLPNNQLPVIPSGYPWKDNETICFGCDGQPDYLITNLLIILLPIIAFISIVLYFYRPKVNKDNNNENI